MSNSLFYPRPKGWRREAKCQNGGEMERDGMNKVESGHTGFPADQDCHSFRFLFFHRNQNISAGGFYVLVPGGFMFSRLCLTFPFQGLNTCDGERNVITPHFQTRGGDHLCRRLSVCCPSCATLPTGRRRYELCVSELLRRRSAVGKPPNYGIPPYTYIYIYIYMFIYLSM